VGIQKGGLGVITRKGFGVSLRRGGKRVLRFPVGKTLPSSKGVLEGKKVLGQAMKKSVLWAGNTHVCKQKVAGNSEWGSCLSKSFRRCKSIGSAVRRKGRGST